MITFGQASKYGRFDRFTLYRLKPVPVYDSTTCTGTGTLSNFVLLRFGGHDMTPTTHPLLRSSLIR